MKHFEHILNMRDLGGLCTADGSMIQAKKLYRSASLGSIDADEKQHLLGDCRIRSIIDLRTTFERNAQPDPPIEGITNQSIPLLPAKSLGLTFEDGNLGELLRGAWNPDDFDIRSLYTNMVDEVTAPRWRAIFKTLLNSDNTAILWHCTNGKDRTGVVAALILLTLGVPQAAIMDDYLRTNNELASQRMKTLERVASKKAQPGIAEKIGSLLEARSTYLQAVFDYIDATYDGLAGFLEDICQIGIAEDDELRKLYLQ